MIVAERMISPPIVGVPCFCIWPSNPRSRTVSPTCMRRNRLMMPFPHHSEMSNETNTAIAARKEMKPNKPRTWNRRHRTDRRGGTTLFVQEFKGFLQHGHIIERVFHPVDLLIGLVSLSGHAAPHPRISPYPPLGEWPPYDRHSTQHALDRSLAPLAASLPVSPSDPRSADYRW